MAVFAATAAAAPPAPFSNGFETDTHGWNVYGGQYDATRVPSGTNGITASSGGWFALAGQYDLDHQGGSAATDWGASTATAFPAGGYTTSVDIYLNVAGGYANDTRFDWDSAILDSSGGFLSDFVFNAGFYTAGGPHFLIGASPNAGRGSTFPANPCPNPGPASPPNVCRTPVSISTSGWYTFMHHFYDSGGQLAVGMSILNSVGGTVASWTIYQGFPTSTVGAPAYGWFDSVEFPFLAFDNSSLSTNLQAQKQGVLDQVNAAIPGAAKHDADKLKDVSKKLTDSLKPSSWIDGTHLQPKGGDHVFDNEEDAIHSLNDLLKGKKTQIPAATLQGWIDSLVQVDGSLAQVAIDDATAAGGDPKKIADAQKEMAKAQDSLAKGNEEDAVDHYKNAWHKAQDSMKKL